MEISTKLKEDINGWLNWHTHDSWDAEQRSVMLSILKEYGKSFRLNGTILQDLQELCDVHVLESSCYVSRVVSKTNKILGFVSWIWECRIQDVMLNLHKISYITAGVMVTAYMEGCDVQIDGP